MKYYWIGFLICGLFACNEQAEGKKSVAEKVSALADSLAKVKMKVYDLENLDIPAFEEKIPLKIQAPDSATIEPNVVSVVENGITVRKGLYQVNIDIYKKLKDEHETVAQVKQNELLQLKKDTSLAEVNVLIDEAQGFVYQTKSKTMGTDYGFFYVVIKDNVLYEIQPAMNMLGNYHQDEVVWMYKAIKQ